jgi:hypothetical protein
MPRSQDHVVRGHPAHCRVGMAHFGDRGHTEVRQLCPRGTERPTVGQWWAWYARCRHRLSQHTTREDRAGTFARRWARAGRALEVCLEVAGVESTNNIAERAHRSGVLWRKRSQGTCGAKNNRGMERVLSLRHTNGIRGRPTFPLLVDAGACLYKGERPDLCWITQHDPPLSATAWKCAKSGKVKTWHFSGIKFAVGLA